MSGRRIDDMGGMPHTSDMSMKSKTHLKEFSSADGALPAHLGVDYHDTTEKIKGDQEHGMRKASGHKIKPGYRN